MQNNLNEEKLELTKLILEQYVDKLKENNESFIVLKKEEKKIFQETLENCILILKQLEWKDTASKELLPLHENTVLVKFNNGIPYPAKYDHELNVWIVKDSPDPEKEPRLSTDSWREIL